MTDAEKIARLQVQVAAMAAINMAILEWHARESDAPGGYIYGMEQIALENAAETFADESVNNEIKLFFELMPDVTEGMPDPDAAFFDGEDT